MSTRRSSVRTTPGPSACSGKTGRRLRPMVLFSRVSTAHLAMPLPGEVAVNRMAVGLISLAILVSTLAQHPVSVRPYQTRVWGHPQIHVAVIGDSYTTGTDEGGEGPNAWTARAWQALGR